MKVRSIKVRGFTPYRTEQVVDLDALPGPLVAVTGPNGAGKSTLLELMLAAFYRRPPTRGSLKTLATERDACVEVAARVEGRELVFRQLVDSVSEKSEAFVDGVPSLASGKVRDFDAWASLHLPAEEVALASIFSAQAAAGFLGAKRSERKSILLRALGIDRLERLAQAARERARSLEKELAVVEARIREIEPQTVVDRDARERAVVELDRARATLGRESRALEEGVAEVAAERTNAALRTERARLVEQRDELREKLRRGDEVMARVRDRIASAPDEPPAGALDVAREALAFATTREHEARAAWRELVAQARSAHETVERLRRAAKTAGDDVERAVRELERAENGAPSEADVDALRERARAAKELLREAEAALMSAREVRVAGAEERIAGLRSGLEAIRDFDSATFNLASRADRTLRDDDALAVAAETAPARIREFEAECVKLSRDHVQAERALVEATRRAERLVTVRQSINLDALRARALRANEELEVATERLAESTASARTAERVTMDAEDRTGAIKGEVDALEARARASATVAADRVRLEEAAPRRAELVEELDKLDEQLARTPEVPAWRHSVSPDTFERLLRENVDIARGRVERFERTLAELDVAARAAADAEKRLGELLSKGQALAGALADAEKVAADLGRDGLQALELDAAGPELSVLATDLLHRAFGARWTVSFETLRSSADGKRELETLEVRVLDTHTGYEGPVEALSGGERAIVGEAVSLALTVLACRSAGLEAPTLVRDESGAALDPAKSEAYVRMLRIAAELVGASRVLFVSHDPRAAELADSRIEIVDGVIVAGAAKTAVDSLTEVDDAA